MLTGHTCCCGTHHPPVLGHVDRVAPEVAHALSVGDAFEFTLSYELLPPTTSSSLFNRYEATIAGKIDDYGFDPMRAGTGILAYRESGRLYFENDFYGPGFGDSLPGGWRGRALTFFFHDPLTANPGELPTSVSSAATMNFHFYYALPESPGGRLVEGQAHTIRRVPEPGALLVVGLGLLGCVPRIRRQLQQGPSR